MVRMAEKLMFGHGISDWQERINVARMREERAARARKIMRQHGIPVLLAWSGDNVRYLTGLRGAGSGQGNKYVLFSLEHDTVVWDSAGWVRQMPDQAPWIKHWRITQSWAGGAPGALASQYQAGVFAEGVYRELKERGLAGEKLGVVGVDGLGRAALEKLGVHCVEAKVLMMEARQVKTRDEITCLKTVAAIAEAAWYKLWETIRPGVTEKDLILAAGVAAFQAGADELPATNFFSGPETFERGFDNTDRMVQTGDLVYAALCHGIRYMGYINCQYRTFITGRPPNQKEKDWYKILLDRVNAVIGAIKPGATTADAAKHFDPASKWGYTDEAEVLSIEIGHGIGIGGGHDYPIINRQWSLKHPQVIEPGMVIAVESCEGERRVGGVRLEDMVVVTENGCELIDHFPREEILVAPAR
ncbi:MAG: aminopeptidase P family protein [Chloroflexi bacterium]|nr:aminopeptidase P family protein [Chloroflexota bacterium]